MACRVCQLGLPQKSRPSHHTVPASRASRSVSDMAGMTRRNVLKIGWVNAVRRIDGIRKAIVSAITTSRIVSHSTDITFTLCVDAVRLTAHQGSISAGPVWHGDCVKPILN